MSVRKGKNCRMKENGVAYDGKYKNVVKGCRSVVLCVLTVGNIVQHSSSLSVVDDVATFTKD